MKSRPPADTHAECIAPQAIPAILAPPPCRPSLLADVVTSNARGSICVGDCLARRSFSPSCPLPPAPQQNRAPCVAVTHRVCCEAMDQRHMPATTSPIKRPCWSRQDARQLTPTREASPLGLPPRQQWAANSMIPPPRAPACRGHLCGLTPQSVSEMMTSASGAKHDDVSKWS